MTAEYLFRECVIGVLLPLTVPVSMPAQTPQRTAPPSATQQTATTPTHADILRGEYGRYRANNDLLSYHLDIRIDPEKKCLSGKNTIRFRMLKDDNRIQLDLYDNLKVDKIVFTGKGERAKGQGVGEKGQGGKGQGANGEDRTNTSRARCLSTPCAAS